jgi:hypothetical protein
MTIMIDHPKEFALEQVFAAVRTTDSYLWSTHGGAEIDLLIFSSPIKAAAMESKRNSPKQPVLPNPSPMGHLCGETHLPDGQKNYRLADQRYFYPN